MQHKDFTGYKLGISVIGGFILDCLGGWDNMLALVFMLVVVDTISGVLKAIKTKTLSSTQMREGLFKKAMIVFIIMLAVEGDKVIIDFWGKPIMWNNHELYLRTAFCLWFILEELISVIENCSVIGVPLPKWLRDILIQVNDGINETTPTQIVSMAKKLFGNKPEGNAQPEHKVESDPVEDSGTDNTLLEDSANIDK